MEEWAVNNSVIGTYQKFVKKCTHSNVQGVMNPRNIRQTLNLQNHIGAKKCISRGDTYNIYAMTTQFDNFFWQIDLYPKLDAMISLKDILDMFTDLLTVQSNEFQITLAYDTTFLLADFSVTYSFSAFVLWRVTSHIISFSSSWPKISAVTCKIICETYGKNAKPKQEKSVIVFRYSERYKKILKNSKKNCTKSMPINLLESYLPGY